MVERVIVAMMPECQRDLSVEQSRPSASESSDDAGERPRDVTVERSRPSASKRSGDAGERQRDLTVEVQHS